MKSETRTVRDPGYEYRAFWSAEDEAWVGQCDGFMLLSHLAQTRDEAIRGIRSLVADIVANMRADGEPLPEATHWQGMDNATTS